MPFLTPLFAYSIAKAEGGLLLAKFPERLRHGSRISRDRIKLGAGCRGAQTLPGRYVR